MCRSASERSKWKREHQSKRRDTMAGRIWLQRLLTAAILAVTTLGIGSIGLLWVTPWAEASMSHALSAQATQAISPSLSNLTPRSKSTPATASPPAGTAPLGHVSVREVQKVVLAAHSI